EELGIEPGRHLQEVQRRVLADADVPPRPAADQDDVSAVVSDETFRPAELPRDIRGFVGRRSALARLGARQGQGGSVWVISGTAGVGKTALALHWAHSVRERFPDGQLYLDLRGFDPDHEPLTPVVAL